MDQIFESVKKAREENEKKNREMDCNNFSKAFDECINETIKNPENFDKMVETGYLKFNFKVNGYLRLKNCISEKELLKKSGATYKNPDNILTKGNWIGYCDVGSKKIDFYENVNLNL